MSHFLLHKIEGYHGGIWGGVFEFQMFGYRVSFAHLWKKIQGEVKTMFGHMEFGGHFKKLLFDQTQWQSIVEILLFATNHYVTGCN